jgi:hypothetical protein
MSRKSRMKAVREAKDKRTKMLAIGGFVVLAAVLAFEMPHVLKRGGGSSAPPPAPAATAPATSGTSATGAPATGTAAPATTPAGTAAAAVLPTASATLPNTELAPKPSKSELFSFTRFQGKDPFAQQVTALPPGVAGQTAGGQPATSSPTGSAGKGTGGAGAGATSSQSGSVATTSSVRTLAQGGSATISVNGRAQVIRLGASFPSSNPLFKLVSIAHGSARIGIANGSYASGANTIALAAGKTVTLVDTADGVRYKLQLVSAS